MDPDGDPGGSKTYGYRTDAAPEHWYIYIIHSSKIKSHKEVTEH
jgi:hypothetical protein